MTLWFAAQLKETGSFEVFWFAFQKKKKATTHNCVITNNYMWHNLKKNQKNNSWWHVNLTNMGVPNVAACSLQFLVVFKSKLKVIGANTSEHSMGWAPFLAIDLNF